MKRKDYTGSRFGRLTVIDMLYQYKNKQTYAKCLCDCGNQSIVYVGSLVSGKTTSCGCFENESRYGRKNHEKDLTNRRFGHLIAIQKADKRYANGGIGWLCKCDCGKEITVRSSSLLRGKTRSCGCNKRSQYEEFIEDYLSANNIQFETEYRFIDCRNSFPLPFDFYIDNYNGEKYCIEYQGQHHYEVINGWGGQQKFETVKMNDAIKASYCNEHNINLICLPYTLSKQEIKQRLDNILEPVTTTVI